MKEKYNKPPKEFKFDNNDDDSEDDTNCFNTSIKVGSKRISIPVTSKHNTIHKVTPSTSAKRKRHSEPILGARGSLSAKKQRLSTTILKRAPLEFKPDTSLLHDKVPTASTSKASSKDVLDRVVIEESDCEDITIESGPSDNEDHFDGVQTNLAIDDSSSCDTVASSYLPHISQASSNPDSQSNQFSITTNTKANRVGMMKQLDLAKQAAFLENLMWDAEQEPPNSQRRVITVASTEVQYGIMLVFFTLDNQKCLMFVDMHQKIISKIRPGAKLVFCHDNPPYQHNEVNMFTGISKIKIED